MRRQVKQAIRIIKDLIGESKQRDLKIKRLSAVAQEHMSLLRAIESQSNANWNGCVAYHTYRITNVALDQKKREVAKILIGERDDRL